MLKQYIPIMLTFLNLICGVLSMIETINKNYFLAALLIILGALVDRYDGRIARALNVSSEIGKELDSLSDLVSFGIAPAFLIFFKYGLNSNLLGILSMLFYIICGCYRLAKYNISNFEGIFSGIPITICGCALSILSFINIDIKFIPMIFISMFGYLMISNIKLKKI